jgi:hypothetical protein
LGNLPGCDRCPGICAVRVSTDADKSASADPATDVVNSIFNDANPIARQQFISNTDAITNASALSDARSTLTVATVGFRQTEVSGSQLSRRRGAGGQTDVGGGQSLTDQIGLSTRPAPARHDQAGDAIYLLRSETIVAVSILDNGPHTVIVISSAGDRSTSVSS